MNYYHAPSDYICPICLAINGDFDIKKTLIQPLDIFFSNDLIFGFMSSFEVVAGFPHPLIAPKKHYENIYTLPAIISAEIGKYTSKVAFAVRTLYIGCEGVTILQNNEPASNQHAFHYHQHLFPRFNKHNFYKNEITKKKSIANPLLRARYASKIAHFLST